MMEKPLRAPFLVGIWFFFALCCVAVWWGSIELFAWFIRRVPCK